MRRPTRSYPAQGRPSFPHVGTRTLVVGAKAPVFEAQSTRGTICLTDFRGKKHVILVVYPGEYTPLCVTHMQAFQKELARFEELGAQVVGVSPDRLDVQYLLSTRENLHFPLIADVKGEVMGLYAYTRMTFIIDKSGVIRFMQKGVPDTRTLINEVATLNCLGRA